MKFLAIFATLLLIDSLVARQITGETLDELENLIKAYKDSNKKETVELPIAKAKVDTSPDVALVKSAAENGLKIVGKVAAKVCGIDTRFEYQKCLSKATATDDQSSCALLFVETYSKCYFGESLNTGHNDISVCEGSCLWNFDHCLINSSKVEMFVCISGRKRCSSNCPWPTSINEKREKRGKGNSCNNNCEGEFDLCTDAIQAHMEMMICSVTRQSCRGICRKGK